MIRKGLLLHPGRVLLFVWVGTLFVLELCDSGLEYLTVCVQRLDGDVASVHGAGMAVSNPVRSTVVYSAALASSSPVSSRHCSVSVEPFQLTYAVASLSDCCTTTSGGTLGSPVHGAR